MFILSWLLTNEYSHVTLSQSSHRMFSSPSKRFPHDPFVVKTLPPHPASSNNKFAWCHYNFASSIFLCKWHKTICSHSCLPLFTVHNAFNIPLCYGLFLQQQFTHFHHRVAFRCKDIAKCAYPLTILWPCELFPALSHCYKIAAMDSGIQIIAWTYIFYPFGEICRSIRLLNDIGNTCLIIQKINILFSTVSIPMPNVWKSQWIGILINMGFLGLFNFSSLAFVLAILVRGDLSLALVCIFLKINDSKPL